VVSAETLAEALLISDPQACADRLIELALKGGGPDNVTVIVANVINAKVGDTIDDVPVIVGGIIPPDDAVALRERGVAAVFTPKDYRLTEMMDGIVTLVRSAQGLG
jgi:methylmalonyl-CoA mutase cobalamin-binding domain/chain